MESNLPRTAEVVVIGGGVMGASTAYHLAAGGEKDVLLLERDLYFGQGATGRCAGGVRYQFATEVNIMLSKMSLPMLERFPEEIGHNSDYRKCGYLFVLTNQDDLEAFKKNVILQHQLGIETELLEPDEVRAMVPTMKFEEALGGTFHAKDGLADPNSVVMGYINKARELGATALNEVEVLGISVSEGRITSVETSQGNVECGNVVNAAGPWAGLIGKMAGVEIPISPVRRQMVTTTPLPDLPEGFPFVIDFAKSLYFHREGEGILTGMSNIIEKPGFDQSIDEGWEIVALEAAMQRMPSLKQADRLSGWAGLYEITPDAHPIFGPSPIDGFWVVAGFSGHGFMHGPIAGKLMAEYLLEGQARSVDVSGLDLARFAEGRLIHEYNVI